uniref:Glycoside hydrolase family 28 n=1 Tax=Medauroidea extradentata TaxID=614211 RepID=A0A191XT23_9NEOP|nr:glycoside hydrolase family 28 [Medauroidea extradentata]
MLINMKQSHSFLAAITILVLLHTGTGKDLRTVTEPKNPPICTTLKPTSADETKTIQKALDSCAKGKAVALSSGTFVSGPLNIPSGVSLLVEQNAVLEASTDPKAYDRGNNNCGTINDSGGGCNAFISITGATGSGIYGKGKIDGRANHIMTGSNITWWQLAYNASKIHKNQNNPKLIQIANSKDITLYQITLVNSPYFHVQSRLTYGFTVWGITINSPFDSVNSDGIDPTGSINVTIAHSNISTGDDCIAVSSLYGPSKHISIYNNYFGHGNSMGIGSGTTYGISEMTVTNLTMNNVRYGLYIKSNTKNGGLVTNITYNNVCITGEQSRWPISLDTSKPPVTGNHVPQFKNIVFNNIRILNNDATIVLHGLSQTNPVEISINNVHIKKGTKMSVVNAKVQGTWKEDASGTSC